jgi:hypothetical protein
LETSTIDWKQRLLPAINAAKTKLSKFYNKTLKELGDFYNFGTILNPMVKLEMYRSHEWGWQYVKRYRADFLKNFKDLYDKAQSVNSQLQSLVDPPRGSAPSAYMPLPSRSDSIRMTTEAEQYLQEGSSSF